MSTEAVRGERRDVETVTALGTLMVPGEVFGLWAVTPCLEQTDGVLGYDLNFWAITHVPTGHSLGNLAWGERSEVVEFAAWIGAEFTAPVWDTTSAKATVPQAERDRLKAALNDFQWDEWEAPTPPPSEPSSVTLPETREMETLG